MISDQLKRVITTELNLEDYQLTEATTAPEVPGWDSLSHVRILCAVEKEFKVRFGNLEIIRLKSVGDLQTLVNRKVSPAAS
jgi:acyl carrier protein